MKWLKMMEQESSCIMAHMNKKFIKDSSPYEILSNGGFGFEEWISGTVSALRIHQHKKWVDVRMKKINKK